MTAVHRLTGTEVAVKFILKDKITDHSWIEDKVGPVELVDANWLLTIRRPFADCQRRSCYSV
jgi:hypothetical protein